MSARKLAALVAATLSLHLASVQAQVLTTGDDGGDDGAVVGRLSGGDEPTTREFDPFGEGDGTLGYDNTPLCNYLNRGIADQGAGHRDRYVLAPPDVQSLSDIEHLWFGLDLPASRCNEDPRTIPCADKDDPKDWCVRRVELAVAGFKLFDQAVEDGEDCLFTAHGGEKDGGMRKITGYELRNNEHWSLSWADLESLLPHVSTDANGKVRFRPKQVRFGAALMAGTIEGLVGQYFNVDDMGCANEEYCSHRRGRIRAAGDSNPLFRWSSAGHVDCDFGDCPSTGSRKSSPWVEIRGVAGADPAAVDMDLEASVVKGGIDEGDCERLNGKLYCGTEYKTKAYGSVRLTAEFPCLETGHAEVQVAGREPGLVVDDYLAPGGDPAEAEYVTVALPYCADVDPAKVKCLQPVGLMPNSGDVAVSCPVVLDDAGEPEPLDPECGLDGEIVDTTYGIAVRLNEPSFDAEGGIYTWLLDGLCAVPNLVFPGDVCSADRTFTKQLRKALGEELLDTLAFEPGGGAVPLGGYEGCPAVTAEADGALVMRFDTLQHCPPGNHDPNCGQFTAGGGLAPAEREGDGQIGELVADVPAPPYEPFEILTYDEAPTGGFVVAGLTADSREEDGGGLLRGADDGIGNLAIEGDTQGELGGIDDKAVVPETRLSMAQIDEALVHLCALGNACAPLDYKALPLAQMATMDPAELEAVAASVDPEEPATIDAAAAELDFLLGNLEFRTKCLANHDPGLDPALEPDSTLARLVLLAALQSWYNGAFDPALNGACQDAPGFEEMFPAVALQVTITTGGSSVADGFAFVNFRTGPDVPESAHATHNCAHRAMIGLPPADAPQCDEDGFIEGEPGAQCGERAGGPCADLTAPYYYDGFGGGLDGSFDLNRGGLHPNGDHSWRHRCFDDVDTGEPMVCTTGFYPGAGQNEWPVCKRCGIPPDGEDSDLYTMVGCEPIGPECPAGLALGTDGKCWDVVDARPEWECAADCKAMYGDDYGYCLHGPVWMDYMRNKYALFGAVDDAEPGAPYQKPICADWSCPMDGVQCGWRGQACNAEQDGCQEECWDNSDCQANDPAPAYPNGFICSAEQTCISQ